jgi:molybdenum cofactor cytidylyltransferase
VFIFLGDMPDLPPSVAGRLAAALAAEALAAAPAFNGKRGHPVLLRSALFPDLLSLQGDQGAGRLLDGLGERLTLVPVDEPGVLFDVDRPERG